MEFPPREFIDPKNHQQHFKPANLRLQMAKKVYASAPRRALDDLQPDDAEPTCPPLLATVGAIARRSVGVRRAPRADTIFVDRYAPTGGNLGSPQLYLVARESLGEEAWFYDVHNHGTVRLWDARRRAPVSQLALGSAVTALAWGAGGIAAGTRAGEVVVLAVIRRGGSSSLFANADVDHDLLEQAQRRRQRR